jgi:hypothetical protein
MFPFLATDEVLNKAFDCRAILEFIFIEIGTNCEELNEIILRGSHNTMQHYYRDLGC